MTPQQFSFQQRSSFRVRSDSICFAFVEKFNYRQIFCNHKFTLQCLHGEERLSQNQTSVPDESNYETENTFLESFSAHGKTPRMLFIAFMIGENIATRTIQLFIAGELRDRKQEAKEEKLFRLQSFYSLDRYITFYTFYSLIYINSKFILSLYKVETLHRIVKHILSSRSRFKINLKKTFNLNRAPCLASDDAHNQLNKLPG